MIYRKLLKFVCWIGIGLCLLSNSVSIALANNNMGKIDNWDIDGTHGTLHVHGALTESACRLAMSSEYQMIDLGITGTGNLQKIGSTGTPVAFQFHLEDCLSVESRARDQLGNLLWSPDLPAMKIRFLAPENKEDSRLVAVNGVSGIGLKISDKKNNFIPIGEYSSPQLLSLGHNQFIYYVTPVRTSASLISGVYQAIIQFQLIYE